MTILAGTGHRDINNMQALNFQLTRTFDESKPDAYIQGMADGFDLQSAVIAINMHIPVISAMPWPTHYKITKFPDLYRWVLDHSEEVFPVTEVENYPGPWVYFKRNEWMIDECDRVIAWWDGRENGGTYGAIEYAKKTNKKYRNIYVPF